MLFSSLFKCKHPAKFLVVEKNSTEVLNADPNYINITHHLRCMKCMELVDIGYAKLTEGATAYLEQAVQRTFRKAESQEVKIIELKDA